MFITSFGGAKWPEFFRIKTVFRFGGCFRILGFGGEEFLRVSDVFFCIF